MIKLNKNKYGFGYLVVLGFAAVLVILFTIFGRVKASHQQLQSKDVRRFVATNIAESALNCIIAEMNANRAFNTHRYYSDKLTVKHTSAWEAPVKKRESLLGEIPGMKINGVNNGIYSGSTQHGEFKAKFAQYYAGYENVKTKTLKEGGMYTVVEVVVKSGFGAKKDVSCRKVTAMVERRYPANENVLYDGELLDLGESGPFTNNRPNIISGRIYGQHYINFNTGGGTCSGNEFVGIEKIETPGFIKSYLNTKIDFSNKTSLILTKLNDSLNVKQFDSKNGYIVDGAHGAHPIKLKRLPKERIKKTAKTYNKSYGWIIEKDTLKPGKYVNPYNTKDKFVDLDFGGYKVIAKKNKDKEDEEGENRRTKPTATSNKEDNEAYVEDETANVIEASGNAFSNSDDPEYLRKLKGEKVIIYAEVPLRIWGCPDRDITIYSTEDIVIAGDFNQNPLTSQVYSDKDYIKYKSGVHNGVSYRNSPGNKVGAMIMSEKRVLIDMSRPTLFVKNEMKPYFLWCLAQNLHPSSEKIEKDTKLALCPSDPTKRGALVGLGPETGENGEREPYYGTIAWLCKNPTLNGGGTYNINMEDIIKFFTPGEGKCFGIKDEKERIQIIEELKTYLRNGGDLTVDEQDKLFERVWNQASLEEEKEFDKHAGAAGMVQALFDEAIKDDKDGIFIPEITINAGIITSTRRAASWILGNSTTKAKDEIGNKMPDNYIKKPGFIIQRIYGSYIRLGTNEPDYFIDGSNLGECIIRRRVWDNTNMPANVFKPLECPAVHNLLTFRDEQISLNEYEKYGG